MAFCVAQLAIIVYDCVALDLAFTIIRAVLAGVAAAFWILYIREALFRSGRIRTQSLVHGLTNLLLMLSIALVTALVFFFVSGLHSVGRAH